jgi:hypothetical protein
MTDRQQPPTGKEQLKAGRPVPREKLSAPDPDVLLDDDGEPLLNDDGEPLRNDSGKAHAVEPPISRTSEKE